MWKNRRKNDIEEEEESFEEIFDTVKAQEYIDQLETPEEVYEYLQSEKYFKTFSNQLAYMMEEKGITRKELVEKCGKQNISNWLSGKKVPSRLNIIKLCFALQCQLEESDILLSKFAGIQKLNPDDLEDAVYIFCLTFQMDFEKITDYMKAKDQLVADPHALDSSELPHIDRFITYIQSKIDKQENNKERKRKVLEYCFHHPKIYLGDYSKKDGIVKPIVEFIYNEDEYDKAKDRLEKLLNGRLSVERDEFIRLIIACGYSEIDEINEKLEDAGFYPLYPRNQYDCIYINSSINAELNEDPSLADYLIQLSQIFKEMDVEKDYIIYNIDEDNE